jgi:hypothetical protein
MNSCCLGFCLSFAVQTLKIVHALEGSLRILTSFLCVFASLRENFALVAAPPRYAFALLSSN